MQFFPSLLGEALKCPKCFSRESESECNRKAKEMTCTGDQTLCLFYQHSKEGRSVYFRYCSTELILGALTSLCNNPTKKKNPTRCKVHHCRSNNCLAGSSSGNKVADVAGVA